jgi:predicted nucleotidyltransferase
MEFGLSDTTCTTVRAILGRYPAITNAVLYGSRAKGNYTPGSDIDLTLMGDALDYQVLSSVASALYESDIPYNMDVSVFEKIDNPALREHIERVGFVFYQREDRTAP